jgi:hypothetical protein
MNLRGWQGEYGALYELLPESLRPYVVLGDGSVNTFSGLRSAYITIGDVQVRVNKLYGDFVFYPQQALGVDEYEGTYFVRYDDCGTYTEPLVAIGLAMAFGEKNAEVVAKCAKLNSGEAHPDSEPESDPVTTSVQSMTDEIFRLVPTVASSIPVDQLLMGAILEQLIDIAASLRSINRFGISTYAQ